MTALVPIIGYTSTVSINDGSSNAQQAFASTAKAKIPFGKTKILDYMFLNQADIYAQKFPAGHDSGTFEFETFFNSPDYARLAAVKNLKFIAGTTPVTWQVVTDDATPKTYTFAGILEEVDGPDLDPRGFAMMKAKVAISGGITVT